MIVFISGCVVVDIKPENLEEVVALYVRVFAGPPWFEVLKCASCGAAYSGEDDLLALALTGICAKNPSCGKPLELVPFYTGRDRLGERIFLDALAKGGFVGIKACLGNEAVGFAWGYPLQMEDTPSVWFSKVRGMLLSESYQPDDVFYVAETGVAPELQCQGLGTALTEGLLQRACENGYTSLVFRTKNEALLRMYRKLMGDSGVRRLFNDPDPAKSGTPWYMCDIRGLTA